MSFQMENTFQFELVSVSVVNLPFLAEKPGEVFLLKRIRSPPPLEIFVKCLMEEIT